MSITLYNYRTQHRTVLILFPLILQAVIITQMMSTRREEGDWTTEVVAAYSVKSNQRLVKQPEQFPATWL